MKKILVTGGAGFIGSHTVVALHNAGFYPIIIDDFRNSEEWIIDELKEICNNQLSFYDFDCSDIIKLKSLLDKEKTIDGVIHFAADKAVGESVENPTKYFKNNINTLNNILDFLHDNNLDNLIFSSSCTVYGQPVGDISVNENTPLQMPTSPYGFTKLANEKLIEFQYQSKKLKKVIALRYFNPIGAHPSGKIGELPRGIPSNLIPFITQTAIGKREKITVFGKDYNTKDGTCIRDYIHVCDLANAHVSAIQFALEHDTILEFFNLGMGKGISVLEIIRTFEEVTQQKLNWEYGPKRPGDVEQIFANVQKAEKELKWKCKYTLQDALQHAWQWQKNIEHEK